MRGPGRLVAAAVTQLRADGFEVREEDVARLSPFVRHHSNMPGPRYSFSLPGGTPRTTSDTTGVHLFVRM